MPISPSLTEIPFGLAGKIFRSPMPFSSFDPGRDVFTAYQQAGVSLVVMLTSDAEAFVKTGIELRKFYQVQGFQVLYLPIEDYRAPEKTALLETMEYAEAAARGGAHVAVHCHAGVGRTGTFLACLARSIFQMPAREAIQWVREFVPGAVEVPDQVFLVMEI